MTEPNKDIELKLMGTDYKLEDEVTPGPDPLTWN